MDARTNRSPRLVVDRETSFVLEAFTVHDSTRAMNPMQQFASDNYSGICPEAWQAMAQANSGCAPAYGEDEWTARAADAFRSLFEKDCEVFFVFNGTAANSLALAALCQSYHSVICTESA